MNRRITILGLAGLLAATGFAYDAASTADQAERQVQFQATPTVPPVSIRDRVNALPFQHMNKVPAIMAYRLVAAERGWLPETIDAWVPMVDDIMYGESGYCWNRRRGDVVASYSMCVITRNGTHEDVGFGQVTSSFYGRNALLCTMYQVCSIAQILESPYSSMLYSIVIPIELAGSQPWCFNDRARRYHPTCRYAPW